ncbi:MAG: hypothetical protein ABR955_10940 [Verrucomicrobiota bacterium]|jgi:hypothetical protein
MLQMKVIGLVSSSSVPPDMKLFEWIAALLPVRFQSVQPGCWDGLDAAIFLGLEPSCPGLPSLQIPGAMTPEIPASPAIVQFGQSAAVPSVFRGRVVRQENLTCDGFLNLNTGDQTIATFEGHPLWIVRGDGHGRTDFSAMSLPSTKKLRSLFESLIGPNFCRLLPLVDFLRRLTGEPEWSSPGLRACFMFDDPNLHSTHYGWINYRELAQNARLHNYHAAMATVPLDAWFACKKAVRLFADNQTRLSLLIHGNDHLYKELASFSSDQQRLGSLAQALNRISRLEAKTSVEVSKVMAAPHGACSEETLRVMARLGFEAACISHGSLHNYNSDKPWAKNIGFGISELVAGLPVIPRFRISYKCQNSVLLAAYLDQPIIPVGHHQDVASGLDMLKDLAAFINSLGDVRWMDMKCIARSNYKTRREGSLLQVQSFARVFNLRVPPGVTQVSIQRPKMDEVVQEGICIRRMDQPDQVFSQYLGEPFSAQPGADLEITSFSQNRIDPSSVRLPKLRIWSHTRRILTEGRDRFSPLICRLKGQVRENGAQKT